MYMNVYTGTWASTTAGCTPTKKESGLKSEEIKSIRKQYGLNTKQFAEICGVSPRTVENWEQGRRMPSNPAMMLLAVWIESQK